MGSEMCIRDRAHTRTHSFLLCLPLSRHLLQRVSHSRLPPCALLALLPRSSFRLPLLLRWLAALPAALPLRCHWPLLLAGRGRPLSGLLDAASLAHRNYYRCGELLRGRFDFWLPHFLDREENIHKRGATTPTSRAPLRPLRLALPPLVHSAHSANSAHSAALPYTIGASAQDPPRSPRAGGEPLGLRGTRIASQDLRSGLPLPLQP